MRRAIQTLGVPHDRWPELVLAALILMMFA
jgi:hypothetical protein